VKPIGASENFTIPDNRRFELTLAQPETTAPIPSVLKTAMPRGGIARCRTGLFARSEVCCGEHVDCGCVDMSGRSWSAGRPDDRI
jgi:hypothetical protein